MKCKNGGLRIGVGTRIGVSSSSKKPSLQLGQRRSEDGGEGKMDKMQFYWWQKYWGWYIGKAISTVIAVVGINT